jgi:ferredoxin-NADP reductase
VSVWFAATVEDRITETEGARTLVLSVPGWPGHVAGQHVDVRLTADDGYTAVRSYSIASAAPGERIDITVEQVEDGEVSPFLVEDAQIGTKLEVRGPVGGWFVWRPSQTAPIQLIGGGSGIVPLMAIIRARMLAESMAPISLLYSVRTPAMVIYRDELDQLVRSGVLSVTFAYTREAPSGWPARPGRVDASLLAASAWTPADQPDLYVCGPTGFVEAMNDLLIAAGHDMARIKAERFGPTGGTS